MRLLVYAYYANAILGFMKLGYSRSMRGFTIIELLLVVVIIGILSSIIFISYNGVSQKAIISSMKMDLSNVVNKLKIYQIDDDQYPLSLDELDSVRPSAGNNYQYVVSNNTMPIGYCVATLNGSMTYHTDSDGTISVGDCSDYGLVLRLDAGNPLSYPGSGDVWTDLSNSNNNGTLIDSVNVHYDSSNDGIMSFSGATDDYVDFGTSDSLKPKDISVSVWVKVNTLPTWAGIISNMNSWGTGFSLQIGTAQNIAAMVSGEYLKTSWVPQIGVWYHIVATHNYSTNLNKLYVNGNLENSSVRVVTYASGAKTNLGVFYTSPSLYLNGDMGEVKIYSRILSAGEISDYYSLTSARYQ